MDIFQNNENNDNRNIKENDNDDKYHFKIRDNLNISPSSYPINLDNISELYNLSIPNKLPNITIENIANNGEIDTNWIILIYYQLQNLVKDIPKYTMPPLFNAHNIYSNEKKIKKKY